MTIEVLKRHLSNEDVAIECNNSVERQAVIAAMLELGFRHGDSGYSKKMLHDPSVEPDHWMHVAFSKGWGIEFGSSSYRPTNISYEEFMLIVDGGKSVVVDDLL